MPKHYKKKKEKREPVPGADRFTTEQEALDRADELGCEGTHTMDEDGQVIYMPCSTHAAYDAITGGGGGSYDGRALEEILEDAPGGGLPDNYRPATSEDVPEGRACGNCIFFNEEKADSEGRAWCEWWEGHVQANFYCNAWQGEEALEDRQKDSRVAPDAVDVGDYVSWDSAGGRARGRITRIVRTGTLDVPDTDFTLNADEDNPAALIRVYRPVRDGWEPRGPIVGHRFATLTKIDPLPAPSPEDDAENRQVDLTPPAYMRASARRGLEWHREGLSGDGIVDRTIREARAMAEGNVTADKWVRTRAWIARHLVDMDAPANTPGDDNYPGPGAVAMALWGGGGTKRSAERALAYAEGVVGRLEEENEGRTVTGEAKFKLETRIVEVDEFEVREDASGMHLEGYAALFDSRSENLGGFTEKIAPGAFRASLKSRNDVKLLWNHNTDAVLGSTRAGTLSLNEDSRGLRVVATLPNTTHGRDASELVKRGDVTGFSFGFSLPNRGGDSWSDDGTERVLKSVRLHEVSLVAFPAYPETNGTATVRGLDKLAKRANVDADALADALLKLEQGEDITADDRAIVDRVLDELAPKEAEPVDENPVDAGMLALKKKKFDLLMKGI